MALALALSLSLELAKTWRHLSFLEREGEKERREIALGIIVLRTNLTIHTWH